MISNYFKIWVAFAFLFVATPVIAESNAFTSESTAKLTPINVQLNWNHQFEFAGFYAAEMQGYYRDAGMEVTLNAWKPGINGIDEVVAGQAHFATGYTSIIANYIKGAPIKLLMASFQFSPMVLLSHEPILSLKQLSGKRVMHYGNMQIKTLIEKANVNNSQAVIELESSGDLDDFINKNTDFYAAYNTNEPYRLRSKGVPFYTLDPKSYGIHSYGDLLFTHKSFAQQNSDLVAQFRDATIKGWQYAIENQSAVVDFILQNYEVVKSREALLQEAAATSVYVQPGNENIGEINPVKLLASAVDAKTTGLLTEDEFHSFDVDNFIFNNFTQELTAKELQFIQENPVLQVGNDSFWEPFEFIDMESGAWKGMSADYFALISQYTGITFKHFKNKSWSDVIKLGKEGKVPIFSSLVETPERKIFLDFTKPYLSFPLVVATLKEVNFIDEFSQLNDKTVAVPQGYWSQEWLASNYPNVKILAVDNVQQGLEAVLHSQAHAYLGNLASINFAIKRYGLDGLHIAGSSNARFELAIGVEKGNDVLLSIMQKALNRIPESKKTEIYNKWIQLELVEKTDKTTLYSVILIALLIIFALGIIISLFYRQKKRQDFYINQINELSMASYTNFNDHEVKWVSKSLLDFIHCEKKEIVGQSHDAIRHPSFSQEKYDQLIEYVSKGKTWKGELIGKGCDDHEYWVEATVTPEIKRGKVVGAWTTRVNITDKKRLEQMATVDSLTGVYNRNQFNNLFESQVHKAGRQESSFCMAMFDVDDFKLINDRYGHQRGDEVLKEIVATTKNTFNRANDFIFRVGGEEFVIICDFESAESFEEFLNTFRIAIARLSIPNPDSKLDVVTISIGGLYCNSMNPFIQSPQLYSIADKALYKAKEFGRNQVVMDTVSEICKPKQAKT